MIHFGIIVLTGCFVIAALERKLDVLFGLLLDIRVQFLFGEGLAFVVRLVLGEREALVGVVGVVVLVKATKELFVPLLHLDVHTCFSVLALFLVRSFGTLVVSFSFGSGSHGCVGTWLNTLQSFIEVVNQPFCEVKAL